MKKRAFRFVSALVLAALAVSAFGQSTPDYGALIQQGKTQLQAGNADLALASGEQAIKLDANRWEGYALAGGALMNLKRYEEAADDFSHAIDRAPEPKQRALRDLRRQCFAEESGAARVPAPTPATNASAPETTTTQTEIVLWKSIENSTNPGDFETYLKQYPNGAFASLAKDRLEKIKASLNETAIAQAEAVRNDPAAALRKGESELSLGQRKAGIRDLRALIQQYPQTPEAMQARSKLNGMGVRIR